jgi:hypothetical protein
MRGAILRSLMPLVLLVALAAAGHWALRDPVGTSWDESLYVNWVVRDTNTAHAKGIVAGIRGAMGTDTGKPPAYRLAVFPLTLFVAPDPRLLRLVSLAVFALTLFLLYRVIGRVASETTAWLGVVTFGLSLGPVWASAHFGTEYVLHFALALMLYAACEFLLSSRPPAWSGPALALAVALGALSKTTFLVVAGPFLACVIALVVWRGERRRAVQLAAASFCGALLAAPWWFRHYREALAFARQSSQFFRHEFPWLEAIRSDLLGTPFSVLIVVMLIAALVTMLKRPMPVAEPRFSLSVACLAGSIPLVVLSISSANHNPRFLESILMLAVVGCAMVLDRRTQELGRPAWAILALLVALQLVSVTRRFETAEIEAWDWKPLQELCDQRGLRAPSVAHLGHGIAFNPPAIEYPWVLRGDEIREQWLWRYEQGPISWRGVEESVEGADVVVTAPDYRGDPEDKQDLDNAHNQEFAGVMRGRDDFEAPVALHMGNEGTLLLVYFKKRI